jgi:hypothetical protein
MPQQLELFELAGTGAMLFDALVVLGFTPAQADEMSEDNEIIDIHRRGRSDGAIRVRKALIAAGERGSVSAIKALNVHRNDDEIETQLYPKRTATSPVKVDTTGSIDALFANLRALHEGREMESRIVKLGKKKVQANG